MGELGPQRFRRLSCDDTGINRQLTRSYGTTADPVQVMVVKHNHHVYILANSPLIRAMVTRVFSYNAGISVRQMLAR